MVSPRLCISMYICLAKYVTSQVFTCSKIVHRKCFFFEKWPEKIDRFFAKKLSDSLKLHNPLSRGSFSDIFSAFLSQFLAGQFHQTFCAECKYADAQHLVLKCVLINLTNKIMLNSTSKLDFIPNFYAVHSLLYAKKVM